MDEKINYGSYLVIIFMLTSAIMFFPSVICDTNQTSIFAVDYTATQNGDWDAGVTWGGATFPGSGDTWQIPEGIIVNITGSQACSTGWNNGTLMFNCSTGTASLTIDDRATITNGGVVNETLSTAVNTASLIGDSLEVFAGTQPVWGVSDAFWNLTEIDFQMDINTGGNRNTFEINGTCRFDSVIIEHLDVIDGNVEILEFDGSFTKSGTGTFTAGTSTLRFMTSANYNCSTSIYNITIDDNVLVTLDSTLSYNGVLTIDGTTGGGITGGDYHIITLDTELTPLVIGSNGLLTGIDYFGYVLRDDVNIASSSNYGDIKIFNFGGMFSHTGTFQGEITCENMEIFSGWPVGAVTVDTGGYALTTGGLTISSLWTTTLKCNSSVIDIGANGLIIDSGGIVDADTSTIEIAGELDNSGSFVSGESTVIIDGTGTQNITTGGDAFATLNITNSNDLVTFVDDTNITSSTWESGINVELGDNMTINSWNVTDTIINSTNPAIERYLFVPIANRTITNTTFNNVTLIPPIPEEIPIIYIQNRLSIHIDFEYEQRDEIVTFNYTGKYKAIREYRWNYGDGVGSFGERENTVVHPYSTDEGEFIVTLEVLTQDGRIFTTSQLIVLESDFIELDFDNGEMRLGSLTYWIPFLTITGSIGIAIALINPKWLDDGKYWNTEIQAIFSTLAFLIGFFFLAIQYDIIRNPFIPM